MAYNGGKKHWDDEDSSYSSVSHSDDSPILSYRHDKRRYAPYTPALPTRLEDRERRSTLSILGKFCLFSVAMIMFCVLMYVPVYNKANYHMPKGMVAGWSAHTNRDTKVYVQPNNVTTVHEPKHVCKTHTKPNKLFLLIVVSSATEHFIRRNAIRATWADYNNYKKYNTISNEVRDKYKTYDYSHDLFPREDEKYLGEKYLGNDFYTIDNSTKVPRRIRKDISSFKQLIPVLADAINHMNLSKTEAVPEKRFDDDDDEMLPGFDMNKEMGTQTESTENFDYEYESNIMKIPPAGYEDFEEQKDLSKILAMLKKSKEIKKVDENNIDEDKDFRVVFLLGMPANDNKTIQSMIEEEVDVYGDIIQEDFIDSYNNLTLKSIMMLKWITNKCNDGVRYILKTDDDMYINVVNLMLTLRNRSAQYDKKVAQGFKSKEYLLIGDLISGARPVSDLHSKWYTPRYMYSGRVYPPYLSGTAYAFSAPAAHALYAAALTTNYFHLEDIYITGMCALRTRPRVVPRDEPLFSYKSPASLESGVCCAHSHVTVHRLTSMDIRVLQRRLSVASDVDRCERIRLTKIKVQQSPLSYALKTFFHLLPNELQWKCLD